MDVIIIFNGLGNQMSQYAFYLKKKTISKSTRFIFSKKSRKIHNGYELENIFGIKYHDTLINKILFFIYNIIEYKKIHIISKPIIKVLKNLGIVVVNENIDYDFMPEYLYPSKGIKFYKGGWHSEKYFFDIRNTIQKKFQFNLQRIGNENLQILKEIRNVTSVSVHIRRGDFVDPNNYSKFGAVCTLNYFNYAIEQIERLVENPHFFFFTNDHEWVKNNFTRSNFSIVTINTFNNSWKDMFLIANCLHNINSNSSFSWWSSWLNKNQNKIVIVPRNFMANRYLKDIYPESWIQLEDY